MSEETNPLLIKIRAVNSANAHANKIYGELSKFFDKYVGKKIFKTDGSLLAKFKLPDIKPDIPNIMVYRSYTHCSLLWIVEMSGYKAFVYIGTIIEDNVLKEISTMENYRTDYTVKEITEKRQQYRDAKKVADKALSEIRDFGEYDT